eukprot:9390718-Ditylum_brightwellii.AAC.1
MYASVPFPSVISSAPPPFFTALAKEPLKHNMLLPPIGYSDISPIHAFTGCEDGIRAEEILKRMDNLYCKELHLTNPSMDDLCPDLVAYTAVISTWAGSTLSHDNQTTCTAIER